MQRNLIVQSDSSADADVLLTEHFLAIGMPNPSSSSHPSSANAQKNGRSWKGTWDHEMMSVTSFDPSCLSCGPGVSHACLHGGAHACHLGVPCHGSLAPNIAARSGTHSEEGALTASHASLHSEVVR